MNELYIRYKVKIDWVDFDDMSIEIKDNIYFNKITLSILEREDFFREKNLLILTLSGDRTECRVQEVKQEADKLLSEILTKLSFIFEVAVGIPELMDDNLNKKTVSYLNLDCSLNIAQKIDTKKRVELISALKEESISSNMMRLYKSAISTEDNIGKFMFLYSILIDLKGPYQSNVDSFIKEVESNVKELLSTKNNKKMETIYTYYRNQIGHTNKNSNVNSIEDNILKLIPKFKTIIKKAIQSES